jgi:plasminogen activator inhibitor 1 RNA-binding protein
MPAALPTVASRPKRAKVAAEEVEARAVDAVVPLTDTAAPLEGENRYMPCSPSRPSFLTKSCSDSEKQAGHGWGAIEGEAELKDEQAGEAIAKAEQKEGEAADADAEAEPEDTSISYSEYLAQLAEKKLQLGAGVPEARKPNEGSKQDKKWATAKPISKEEEEDFVAGSGGKAKRERERKQKQVLDIDQRFVEAPEQRTGGRGGFRGGRGRGDGPSRGGRGEGGFRGGRGDGARGGRGGRGGDRPRGAPRGGASINTSDTSAFPSLGS